jgi:septal ring-binding cell division protein DamX
LSLKADDYTQEDIQNIDLKSVAEEQIENVSNPEVEEPRLDQGTSINDQLEMEEKLKSEMEKLANTKVDVPKKVEAVAEIPVQDKVESPVTVKKANDVYNQKSDFKGKYTIQLYSNQSEESAKDFADGFIVKGYDIIINEVILAGKGKWYRVSVGIFDNVNEAKSYLDKEESLFQSNKYIIQQF